MDEQLPPEPAHYDQVAWRAWAVAHIKHLMAWKKSLEAPKEAEQDAEPTGNTGGEADGDLGEAG